MVFESATSKKVKKKSPFSQINLSELLLSKKKKKTNGIFSDKHVSFGSYLRLFHYNTISNEVTDNKCFELNI